MGALVVEIFVLKNFVCICEFHFLFLVLFLLLKWSEKFGEVVVVVGVREDCELELGIWIIPIYLAILTKQQYITRQIISI